MKKLCLILISSIFCGQAIATPAIPTDKADSLISLLKETNKKCSARIDIPGAQESCDRTDQIATELFKGGWCFENHDKSWSPCLDAKQISVSAALRDNKKYPQEKIFGYVNGTTYPGQLTQIRIFRETYYPERACNIDFVGAENYRSFEMRLPNNTYKGCYAKTLGGGYKSFYLVNGQPVSGTDIPHHLMYTAALYQNGTIVVTGKLMTLGEYMKRIGIYP